MLANAPFCVDGLVFLDVLLTGSVLNQNVQKNLLHKLQSAVTQVQYNFGIGLLYHSKTPA